MYKPTFNKRQVLVFHHFGNKGYSLFSCLGREVVCSVLSVATLTYASAESISTNPVVTDSTAMTTAREMQLEEVSVTGSRAPLTRSQAARMVTVLDRAVRRRRRCPSARPYWCPDRHLHPRWYQRTNHHPAQWHQHL